MSKRTLCCGQTPRVLLIQSMSVRMSMPLTYTDPDEGGNSPVRMDLPTGRNTV